MKDPDHPSGKAAVDYYFIDNDGGLFKTTFAYEPYFCIACKVCFLDFDLIRPETHPSPLEWNGDIGGGMAYEEIRRTNCSHRSRAKGGPQDAQSSHWPTEIIFTDLFSQRIGSACCS